ncbi:MAG: glycosyltransferase family 2 protein [Solirubrobacteraceae bacterium]
MQSPVTVAIPTLNAGAAFAQTLAAVRDQQLKGEVQLLVCDSGSSDGTVALARSYHGDVIEIPRESFSHGGTRNLLMSRARGAHVAFLTQDAVPASNDWLASLLAAFALAADVGLAFGPYRPAPDASLPVARELTAWFASFSDGGPRIDVLDPAQRTGPARDFLGHLGFFTDANGCVARAAWEQVPFRTIAYAEDHLLAQDMLRAGFAKVYVPGAAVIHSHEYSPWQWLRRSFDETRAVREVYGRAHSGSVRDAARNLRGNVGADLRWAHEGRGPGDRPARPRRLVAAATSILHHSARTTGALLGAHSEHLPSRLVAELSLERRR